MEAEIRAAVATLEPGKAAGFRALVCIKCGGIMGTHLPWCKRPRFASLTAGLLLAVMAVAAMAGPASASTARHHRPWYCTVRDWGNIRTEPSGKSYICQPDGRRYTWRIIHEYIEN
jgi:hypothetical protein